MSDRPFVYVCSPYKGDVEKNVERARAYCRQVFEAGYHPVAVHLFFPQFLRDAVPEERAAGMAMGLALLPMCRALVICGDTISEGMKQEIIAAQSIGIETCSLANIPPIPTLDGFQDALSNLDNFDIAVSLVEGMTGCRFTAGVGGVYIYPDEDAYLAVNMNKKWDHKTGLCQVTFDANIRTMGHSMSVDGVLKLRQEIDRTYTLLSLLDSREFVLTQDDMEQLYNSLRQRDSVRDTPPKGAEKPSVLDRIAADRADRAALSERGTPEKPRKSHGEEH